MFLDIAKPVALLMCILSLFAAFRAAFLIPASELNIRIHDGFALLLLSAGVSILGGLLFRESAAIEHDPVSLGSTLPIQIFCWAATIILVLFAVSWYLETYFLPYAGAH
ncbi:MAG: hypothetical protein ABI197_03430 [Granulicella sp.]